MVKKVILFSGFIVATILSIICLRDSINHFVANDYSGGGEQLRYAIYYLLFFVCSMALIVVGVISAIKDIKENRDGLMSKICLISTCALLVLGVQTLYSVIIAREIQDYKDSVAALSPYISLNPAYKELYEIIRHSYIQDLVTYGFSFFPTLTLLVLSILSFEGSHKEKSPKGNSNEVDLNKIKELKNLYDLGALSEDEYKALKEKELAK